MLVTTEAFDFRNICCTLFCGMLSTAACIACTTHCRYHVVVVLEFDFAKSEKWIGNPPVPKVAKWTNRKTEAKRQQRMFSDLGVSPRSNFIN